VILLAEYLPPLPHLEELDISAQKVQSRERPCVPLET
jgi:hypothetical protein